MMPSTPTTPNPDNSGLQVNLVGPNEDSYRTLERKINDEVKKNGTSPVERIEIQRMVKLVDSNHWRCYSQRRNEVGQELGGSNFNQKFLFLTSPYVDQISVYGIDMARDAIDGTFGHGIYLTQSALNASRYAFNSKTGCSAHQHTKCTTCTRKMIVCKVVLGKSYNSTGKVNHSELPRGYHSVQGVIKGHPSDVFVVYDTYQIIPTYYVEFTTFFKQRGGQPDSNGFGRRQGNTSRRGDPARQNNQGNGLVTAASQVVTTLAPLAPVLIDTFLQVAEDQQYQTPILMYRAQFQCLALNTNSASV
ncbi:poly [ADP-ribose] polymerase tankyrase-2-like isoform X2 [Cloeon dipterum]|uniref:poly [ADP-ribose] polymerase tankyrase-2-like isoform X2 n=1 Tax=Cloeon dipterum TaxID=197152 RepID=UPI0032208318